MRRKFSSSTSFVVTRLAIPLPIFSGCITSSVSRSSKYIHTLQSPTTTHSANHPLPDESREGRQPHSVAPASKPVPKPTQTCFASPFLKRTSISNYEFSLGCSLFAKRNAKPLPPPFSLSPTLQTSNAFSSYHFSRPSRLCRHQNTHYGESAEARPSRTMLESYANGRMGKLELLRGITNGDDAAIMSPLYVGVADGVGAWNTRPRGHAALWSRLMLHFWAIEVEYQLSQQSDASASTSINTVEALQEAYETVNELTPPWQGTTTACLALMTGKSGLTVLNLGDSQCFILRPKEERFIFKTVEQWHWFDCPRQLGSNSHDNPREHAVVREIEIQDGDIVIMATDGLPDNLWEHEVLEKAVSALSEGSSDGSGNNGAKSKYNGGLQMQAFQPHGTTTRVFAKRGEDASHNPNHNNGAINSASENNTQTEQNFGKMQRLADALVCAAKEIATDPFAESPYMERGIEQGLAITGGKLDDISVIVGECKRRAVE